MVHTAAATIIIIPFVCTHITGKTRCTREAKKQKQKENRQKKKGPTTTRGVGGMNVWRKKEEESNKKRATKNLKDYGMLVSFLFPYDFVGWLSPSRRVKVVPKGRKKR